MPVGRADRRHHRRRDLPRRRRARRLRPGRLDAGGLLVGRRALRAGRLHRPQRPGGRARPARRGRWSTRRGCTRCRRPTRSHPDVEAAAAAYDQLVRTHGAGDFDLVLLGLGPDGHVASLFPGFPQLDVDDRIAVAVTGSPKPPPERISLTFTALNRTREVWFLVSGEGKADAVARALADEGSVHETPARGITAANRTWWLDQPAASARSSSAESGSLVHAESPSGDSWSPYDAERATFASAEASTLQRRRAGSARARGHPRSGSVLGRRRRLRERVERSSPARSSTSRRRPRRARGPRRSWNSSPSYSAQ